MSYPVWICCNKFVVFDTIVSSPRPKLSAWNAFVSKSLTLIKPRPRQSAELHSKFLRLSPKAHSDSFCLTTPTPTPTPTTQTCFKGCRAMPCLCLAACVWRALPHCQRSLKEQWQNGSRWQKLVQAMNHHHRRLHHHHRRHHRHHRHHHSDSELGSGNAILSENTHLPAISREFACTKVRCKMVMVIMITVILAFIVYDVYGDSDE